MTIMLKIYNFLKLKAMNIIADLLSIFWDRAQQSSSLTHELNHISLLSYTFNFNTLTTQDL
jgi:hypothetical protein